MECKEYAIQLLKETGCALNCYKGIPLGHIIMDLKEYFSSHPSPEFSINEIAENLREIGDEQSDPLPAPYKIVYDMGNTIDSVLFDDYEAAKEVMGNIYRSWLADEIYTWERNKRGKLCPSQKQAAHFNYMIDEYSCCILKWREDLNDYEDLDEGHFLSDEELIALGWTEDGWEKL